MRDKDIREVLLPWIKRQYPGCRLSQEQAMARSSADVVAFTQDEIIVFEIKSDYDTCKRLPSQLRSYEQAASRICLVTGRRHALAALAHPAWMGTILVADEELLVVRVMSENPQRSRKGVLGVLWKSEVQALLERHGRLKGHKSKTGHWLRVHAAEQLSMAIIDLALCSAVRCRVDWRDSDGKRQSQRRRRRRW